MPSFYAAWVQGHHTKIRAKIKHFELSKSKGLDYNYIPKSEYDCNPTSYRYRESKILVISFSDKAWR